MRALMREMDAKQQARAVDLANTLRQYDNN